jgi:hypothetical protein
LWECGVDQGSRKVTTQDKKNTLNLTNSTR